MNMKGNTNGMEIVMCGTIILNRSEACPFGWNYDPEIGPTIVTDVRYQNTLKEHQKFLANAIFQKFLISMVMYEISIIFP